VLPSLTVGLLTRAYLKNLSSPYETFRRFFPFTGRDNNHASFQRTRYTEDDMMKRMIAVALLSMALTACDSTTTENGNTNTGARPAAGTPTPAPQAATPEASPSAAAQFKAGDKVKVNSNGNLATATVVSIDEKTGKATIRIDGEKQDKTVSIAEITKQ